MASVAPAGMPSPGGAQYVEMAPGKAMPLEAFNDQVQHFLGNVLESPGPQLLPRPADLSHDSLAPNPSPRDSNGTDISGASLRGDGVSGREKSGGDNPSLHFCKLCHVWISGELNCRAHLAGRKHIKRSQLHQEQQQQQRRDSADGGRDGIMTITDKESLQAAAAQGSISFEEAAGSSMLMPVSEADKSMVPLYQCTLCNITATSLDHLEAHYRGVKHQKRLALAAMKAGSESSAIVTDSGSNGPVCPGAAFTCTICAITCSSLDNLQTHCRGRKHMKKVAQYHSQLRGDGFPVGRVVDPVSNAMAAASASLAAINLGPQHPSGPGPQMGHRPGMHHQAHMMPHFVQPAGVMHMPAHIGHHGGVVPGMYPQMQPHHMMGSMGEVYMQPMPPMYMQQPAVGPWPAPAHITGAHPHQYEYVPWRPPPPPAQPRAPYRQPEGASPQAQQPPPPPRTCVIEEAQEGGQAEATPQLADHSISFHQADATGGDGSVVVGSDETDELCLSSGHSTPVSLVHSAVHEEEDADRSEQEVLLVTSPPSGSKAGHHSFRLASTPSGTPTRAHHRRGHSDSGFQLFENPLDLRLLDKSLSELANQELADSSYLSLREEPAARHRLGEVGVASERMLPNRRRSDNSNVSSVFPVPGPRHQHSLSLDGSLETATAVFASPAGDWSVAGSGRTSRLLFDDHLVEGPVSKKLSPIGGSSRSQGGSRPSTAGESRGGSDVLGAGSMQRTNSLSSFDPSLDAPLVMKAQVPPPAPAIMGSSLVSSAASTPAGSPAARHLRSQSLTLPREPGTCGFSRGIMGFTAHDLIYAAAKPLPPDAASDTASLPGSFSARASPAGSPMRPVTPGHHRHQSLFLPNKSNLGAQQPGPGSDGSAFSKGPRPPLYRTLSSGGGAAGAAAAAGNTTGLMPSQAGSGGIWTMTESERRKSLTGAWEDGLDAEGAGTQQLQATEAVMVAPAPEAAVTETSLCNQSGDSSLELTTLIHNTSQPAEAPGRSAMTATDNPVFEGSATADGCGAAGAQHHCGLCGISATSTEHLEAHYSGRRHQKSLAALYRRADGPGSGGGGGETARHHCHLCNVSATSEAHLEAHFHGKQHQRKLAAASGTSAVLPTFHCSLCGVNATSAEHLMSHFQGKQHQRKARLAEQQSQGGRYLQLPEAPAEVVGGQQGQWYARPMGPQEMGDPRQHHHMAQPMHHLHHHHHMPPMMQPVMPMAGYQQHPVGPPGWWPASDGGAFMQPHLHPHEVPMPPWMGHVVPMIPGPYN